MDDKRRFTGKQVCLIVVALAVAAVGAPAGVMAATGTSVKLVDRTNPHHAAAVSKKGALSVAVTGTAKVAPILGGTPFSFSSTSGNAKVLTAPCGTKIAISSLSLYGDIGASSGGINYVTVGSSGNAATGDTLATHVAADGTQQLLFPQPFIIKPAALSSGTCQHMELYEDGGVGANFTVVGYQIAK